MFAASAMILTACTTNEGVVPPTSDEVTFYLAQTRATETQFQDGDVISISAVKAPVGTELTELKASGNYADNVHYKYNGGLKRFEFVQESGKRLIELPKDGEGLAYYAVYPKQDKLAINGTFAVQKDQTDSTSVTASDLCTVYHPVSNERKVSLKFWHRLSRICVSIDGVAGKTVTMTLKNRNLEASYDLNANTYVATGTRKGDIKMHAMAANRDFEAIFPPQTFNLGTDIIVTIGGKEYNVTTTRATDTFYSGRQIAYPLEYISETDKIILKIDPVPAEFGGSYIHPWNSDERLDEVVPSEIREKMDDYMPIYPGTNPPNIEGCYYIDPFETVYCEDQGNGGFDPGDLVVSYYCLFQNQNTSDNTIDFYGMSDSEQSEQGNGAFISGSGNNFTAFFNTEGTSSGISTKTALVISGTKTSEGIKDIYYAFVMVEKGEDPENKLMKEGVFRVFHDQDGLAVNATWPGGMIVGETRANGIDAPWTIYSRKK